ncbi:MAG TPA: cyclic nucleotide-gated ion channel [Rhizomicrobium sp.]|nr:cyclic nucleotide-gated ion channel [Rhizomicrobium sp.]
MAKQERGAKRSRRITQPERHTLRHSVFRIIEAGHIADWRVMLFEGGLITLIIANVIAVTLESVSKLRGQYLAWFNWFEAVSVAIFTIEYTVRLWVCVEDPRYRKLGSFYGRVRYSLTPSMIIDFISFAPSIVSFFVPVLDLRILRLFRLLRLMKIARYSPAMATLIEVLIAERRALLGTLLLLLCVMVISAEAMYVIEGPIQANFDSLPKAMYWAITTLTTTGYGDVVPVTAPGRMIAGITMIFGLALFALPVGIVATNFVTEIHRRDFVVTWNMISHLPLFEGFSAALVSDVMSVLRSRMVQEHSQITVAGNSGSEMFFIVSGTARAEYERSAINLDAGDFFGEAALLSGAPYDSTVTARSSMRVLTMSASDFSSLNRRYPKLKRRFEQAAARKEQKLQRRAGRQEEPREEEAAPASSYEVEDEPLAEE